MKRALLVAGAIVLAGCGGSSTPSLSAAPPPSPAASDTSSRSASPASVLAAIRLTGDGLDLPDGVVSFGDDYTDVRSRIVAALGEPTKDTGEVKSFSTYGTCPGQKLRALEYGHGALRLLFGDVIGPGMTLYQWSLVDEGEPAQVPHASAFVGDVTTYEFGVGTTLPSLREGIGPDMLKVHAAEDPFPAGFTVSDQSSGFTGLLTGTAATDTVTGVEAGEACGE